MKGACPKISVILPVYNNAKTVVAAARSILRQTLSDLELIVIDDGSVDDSFARVERLRDPRIRLFRNENNLGVSQTRNRGIELMRGDYMAPMDADDVCHPRRLERTLRRLEEDSSLGLIGGWALCRGWGSLPFVARLPWGPDAVRAYLLFGMPAPHDTLLFRASIIRQWGLRYDTALRAAVDYHFYRQVAAHAGVDTIPSVLMEYRFNPQGITSTRGQEATRQRLSGLQHDLTALLGKPVEDDVLRRHAHIGNGGGARDVAELHVFREWLANLEDVNRHARVYPVGGMARTLAMTWFRVCRNSAHLGWTTWIAWRTSPWHVHYHPVFNEMVAMAGTWCLSCCLPSRRQPQGALPGV